MQEHLLVAGSIKYLVCELVVVVLLHNARVIYQKRSIVDWSQTELGDACAGLAISRVLRVLTLCHCQVENRRSRYYRFVFEVAIDERSRLSAHITKCSRIEIGDTKQVASTCRHGARNCCINC